MNRFRRLVSLAIAFTAISWNAHAYQTRQEISHGDFESGRSSWITTNYSGGASTSSGIMSNSARAYLGNWYGYVGDQSASTFSASGGLLQYMSFTNTTTNLDVSFYLNISSADTTGTDHDYMNVFLEQLDQAGNLIKMDLIATFSNLDKVSGTGSAYYALKRYHIPINSPATKTQQLLFLTQTDGSLYTVFRIDNVSVISYFPDPIINYTVHSSVESGSGTISPIGNTTVVGGGSVSFTASPSSDWAVDKWKMNGSTIQTGQNSFTLDNVAANTDISVSFVRTLHQLNVNVVSGSGSGSYTLNPSGGWYTNGTPVTLTAIPSSGYQFSEWNGSTYSRENQITYNMSAVGSLGLGTLGMSGPKALGDPTISLRFVLNYRPPNVGIKPTSGSTPMFTVDTSQDWLTVVETTWDLNNGVWTPVSVHQGNLPVDFTFPQGQNSGFIRSSIWPLVLAPGFMKFPIHDSESPHTWLSAKVTAIMDHSPMDRLAGHKEDINDRQITTYLGNSVYAGETDQGDGTHMAYIKTNELTRQLEFNYQKTLDSNNKYYLYYDNHQGYDYGGFSTNTDVYPVYEGETVTEDDDFVKTSNLAGKPSYYMNNYHAVIIRHKMNGAFMGYCSVYLHLSDISSSFVDKTPIEGWGPKKGTINMNTPIGKVGSYDKIAGMTDNKSNIHLHFEVWMLHPNGIWKLYDPYGAQATNGDVTYPPLWTN